MNKFFSRAYLIAIIPVMLLLAIILGAFLYLEEAARDWIHAWKNVGRAH